MLLPHSQQSSPMYLPKRIKNLCLHKCLHTYRAVLLIAQTWKQSKCPSVGEKTALWPDNWILFSDKKWATKSWKDINET